MTVLPPTAPPPFGRPPKPLRPALDVSLLPTVTYGSRSLMWWGTLGFMVIEGWALLICLVTIFYLRQNYHHWPPERTPNPSLGIPTIQLVVMLVSLVPNVLLDHAAKRLDRPAARLWACVASGFVLVMLVLRWFEFWALNVRWDTTAYGSILWMTLGAHATLILVQAGETIGNAMILFRDRLPAKTLSDVSDTAFYWWFLILSWLPCYVAVYLLPRWFA